MGVRRPLMNVRSFARIAILIVAAAAIALSCSLDYMLDFELGDIAVGFDYVDVDYSLFNAGSRSMDNAQIHIAVTADLALGGYETLQQWTPGVDLSVLEPFSDTLRFTFSGQIVNPVVVEVIGAGWDEDSSGS
jgi:hypothetical protein